MNIAPGLNGLLAQRQMAQQEQQGQLGQIQGLLGVQQAQMQQGLLGQQMADKQRQQAQIEQFASTLPADKRQAFMVDPTGYIRRMNEIKVAAPGSSVIDGAGGVLQTIPALPKDQTLPWYVRKDQNGAYSIDPAYADFEKTKAANGRQPASPMQPVAYVDDSGKTVWGTINEARGRPAANFSPSVQGDIAGAKAGGTVTGREGAEANLAMPNVIGRAERGIKLIDEMIGSADGKVKPHPGFGSYVGATLVPGARFIEGTDTSNFQAREKQIKGQSFLEAFESLKGAGQITEIEGEKATAALNRMSKAQSETEYKSAAREVQDILRRGVENAKKRASAYNGPDRRAPAGKTLKFDVNGNPI